MLNFMLIFLFNYHVIVGIPFSQDNKALCRIAESIPSLSSQYGWGPCPTNDSCSWPIQMDTLECENGSVTKINLYFIDGGNGTIPTQIGQLEHLTYLIINNVNIFGTIPTQLSNISTLEYIQLYNIQVDGTIPTQIGQLKYLTFLAIHYTGISGTIPSQIFSISILQYLDLSYEPLTGTIPTQIGQLENLTYLGFQNTQLSGIIPTQLSYITNLQFFYLQSTQLYGCPQIHSNLSDCDLSYIPFSCNCTIPPICTVTVNCPDCKGNYSPLFTCINGKWTSSTDVTLNGTNLLYSSFSMPGLSVYGNVLMSEASIDTNSLSIEKNTILTLQNSNLQINGDLNIQPLSTIVLNVDTDNSTINVKNCSFLDGNLIVSASQLQSRMRLPLLTSQCINGTFSSALVNLTDNPQCHVVPSLDYLHSSVSLSFDIVNHCTSGGLPLPLWIYIVIGVVVFIMLLAIIGAVILMTRKLKLRDTRLTQLAESTRPTISIHS